MGGTVLCERYVCFPYPIIVLEWHSRTCCFIRRFFLEKYYCQVSILIDLLWRQFLRPTFSVNGGSSVVVDQPDTGGGHVVLSVPVKLQLNSGSNTITFGASQTSKVLFIL